MQLLSHLLYTIVEKCDDEELVDLGNTGLGKGMHPITRDGCREMKDLLDAGVLCFRVPQLCDIAALCRRLVCSLTPLRVGFLNGKTRTGGFITVVGGYNMVERTHLKGKTTNCLARTASHFSMDAQSGSLKFARREQNSAVTASSKKIDCPVEQSELFDTIWRKFADGRAGITIFVNSPKKPSPLSFRKFLGTMVSISNAIEDGERQKTGYTVGDQ